jgi:DNA polymerase V
MVKVSIHSTNQETKCELLYVGKIKAGFPSPAADFVESAIDINKYIIKHPSATFYARVDGNSMDQDFNNGDILVIDKSLPPTNGKIAVCFVDGEFTVKRIKIEKDKCLLIPSNSDFPVLEVNENNNFMIWGIVTFVIKKM